MSPRSSIALLAALALSCAGCATNAEHSTTPSTPTAPTVIDGEPASPNEIPRPEAVLTTVTAGELIVDGQPLGTLEESFSIATDGRFVGVGGTEALTIIDAGSWTEPHGDHSHSFKTEASVLGTVSLATGAISMHANSTSLAIRSDAGASVVLDRHALENGTIEELARPETTPGPGAILPALGGFVRIDATGIAMVSEQVELISACTGVGAVNTTVGVVAACSDRVVLLNGTEIHELTTPESIHSIATRGTRNLVTLTGDDAAWTLDLRAMITQPLAVSADIALAVALDDPDEHVVTVNDTGAVTLVNADGLLLSIQTDTDADTAHVIASRSEAHVVSNAGHLHIDLETETTTWTSHGGLNAITGL